MKNNGILWMKEPSRPSTRVMMAASPSSSSSCQQKEAQSTKAASEDEDEENYNNYESICKPFQDALCLDRRLKTLHFDVTQFVGNNWDDDVFPRIFKAAILDTKIETLNLFSGHLRRFNFPINLLMEALCHNECKLKELTFYDCAIVQSSSSNDNDQIIIPNDACNKSLETLKFVGAENLDLSMVVEVARRCRSLVSLEMPNCSGKIASNLDLLDPLLLWDEQQQQQQQPPLSVQRLELCGNGINESQAIAFFRKLPQMTCIRKISLVHNPFVFTEAWVPVLVDAIQHNTSVEHLDFDGLKHYSPMSKEELGKACFKLDGALRRNQERRFTDEFVALVRSKVLAEKLWPLVLERAQKPMSLSLFKTYNGERVKQPAESLLEKDLVNRLLKEKMFQDHLY